MNNDGEGCQSLCAELFALCRDDSWRQSAAPAGYEATRDLAQRWAARVVMGGSI
jgi:hypothetical protein